MNNNKINYFTKWECRFYQDSTPFLFVYWKMAADSEPLSDIKIICLGDSAVGKSK